MCGIYHGDGFDDYLKQVGIVYLDLDLSQIAIDNTVLLTPRRHNIVNNETVDSIHIVKQEVKSTNAKVVV